MTAGEHLAQARLRQAGEYSSCVCSTPLGLVRITEDEKGICALKFTDGEPDIVSSEQKGIYLADAANQLLEYFAGTRRAFDVPISTFGSPFQEKVWRTLRNIPYGETRSYQEVARMLGNGSAARAVGMANNRNPVWIMIPCHRVVGKDGKLVGYAGGLERKRYLLDLEASH